MVKKLPFIALILMLAFPALACSVGGVTVDNNTATVQVNLKEDRLNQIFEMRNDQTVNNLDDDAILNHITKIEMHDGYITVFGERERADGTTIEGSYDAAISAENGALQVKITAVNVEGWDMSDPRIDKLNEELTEGLADAANDSNGNVEFQDVKVTEDGLNMTVKVQLNNNGN